MKPDVVISFMDRPNILTLLATRGSGIPVIVSERTDPAGRHIGRQWEVLRRLTYPWADALVCQGHRPLNYFHSPVRDRGHIIPNPVYISPEQESLRAYLDRDANTRTIVALGSLRKEKGFDILLEAFALMVKAHPDWSLTIFGEGPERGALEVQSRKLEIAGCVNLPGVTNDPLARLAEGDLFVLSSRVEGFPNALTEAMSVGLPVIATDVGAVPEIICEGINGLIVPSNDIGALSAAMSRLMRDEVDRCRLGSQAPEVLNRFSLEKVRIMWEDIISQVIGSRLVQGRGKW